MSKSNLKRLMVRCSLGVLAIAIVLGKPAPGNSQDTKSVGAASHGVIWADNGTHETDGLTAVFAYDNFRDVLGLTLNGNAIDGDALLLSNPAEWQIGSVWYNNQVDVADGFVTNFTFKIKPSIGSATTADGMAFVIQNDGLTTLGPNEGQPGYDTIPDSLAVEFDTFLNGHDSDPNNNHIGVQSCGQGPNTLDHGTKCNLDLQPNLPIVLTDGNPHQVTISYIPNPTGLRGILTVAVDKQVVLTSMVNLSKLLSLNGNDAWVGFTAGSGEYWESPGLLSWTYSNFGTAAAK